MRIVAAMMRREGRNYLVVGFGTVVSALLGLSYSVFAGRMLGPFGYADFAAGVSVFMIGRVGLAPVHGTVTRFTALLASRNEGAEIHTLWATSSRKAAYVGLALLVLSVLTVKPLAAFIKFSSPFPLFLALCAVYLDVVLGISRGALRGLGRFSAYSISQVCEAVARLSVGVILIAVFGGATAGLTAFAIALAVTLVVAFIQVGPIRHGGTRQLDWNEVNNYIYKMTAFMLLSAGLQNLNILIVRSYFESSEVGVYAAAFTLSRSVGVLAIPFATLLLPMLTMMSDGGIPAGTKIVKACSSLVLMTSVPLIVFLLWSDVIVVKLFGPDFASGAPLVVPLTVAQLGWSLTHLLGLAGAATGKFRFLAIYVPGLAIQLLCFYIWHDSLETITTILLITQFLILLLMSLYQLTHARPPDHGQN